MGWIGTVVAPPDPGPGSCSVGRDGAARTPLARPNRSPNRVPIGLPNPARSRLAEPPGEFKMPPWTPLYHPLRRPGNAVYGVNSYRGFESLSLRHYDGVASPCTP